MAKKESKAEANHLKRPIANISLTGQKDGIRTSKALADKIQGELIRIDPNLRAEVLPGQTSVHVYSTIPTAAVDDRVYGVLERNCGLYKSKSFVRGTTIERIGFQEQRDHAPMTSFYDLFETLKAQVGAIEEREMGVTIREEEVVIREEDLKKEEANRQQQIKNYEAKIGELEETAQKSTVLQEENSKLHGVIHTLQGQTDKSLQRVIEEKDQQIKTLEGILHESKAPSEPTSRVKAFQEREIQRLKIEVQNLKKAIEKGGSLYESVYEASLPVLAQASRSLPEILGYILSREALEESRQELQDKFDQIDLREGLGEGDITTILTSIRDKDPETLREALERTYDARHTAEYSKFKESQMSISALDTTRQSLEIQSFPEERIKQQVLQVLQENKDKYESNVDRYLQERTSAVRKDTELIQECIDILQENGDSETRDGKDLEEKIQRIVPILVRTSKGDSHYTIEVVLPIEAKESDRICQGPTSDTENPGVDQQLRSFQNAVTAATLGIQGKPDYDWLFKIGELGEHEPTTVKQGEIELLAYRFTMLFSEPIERVTEKSREIVDSLISESTQLVLSRHGVMVETVGIYDHAMPSEETLPEQENNGSGNNGSTSSSEKIDFQGLLPNLEDFMRSHGGTITAEQMTAFLEKMGIRAKSQDKKDVLTGLKESGKIISSGRNRGTKYSLA